MPTIPLVHPHVFPPVHHQPFSTWAFLAPQKIEQHSCCPYEVFPWLGETFPTLIIAPARPIHMGARHRHSAIYNAIRFGEIGAAGSCGLGSWVFDRAHYLCNDVPPIAPSYFCNRAHAHPCRDTCCSAVRSARRGRSHRRERSTCMGSMPFAFSPPGVARIARPISSSIVFALLVKFVGLQILEFSALGTGLCSFSRPGGKHRTRRRRTPPITVLVGSPKARQYIHSFGGPDDCFMSI